MQIVDGHFHIRGIYHIRCNQGTAIPLIYPFPSDSLYGEVDAVFIHDLDQDLNILPKAISRQSALFTVDLAGRNEVSLQISYRQKLLGTQAEYILETTRFWGKPLELANYELIIPDTLHITSFPYPPQDSLETGGYRVYYWEMQHFMPEVNMLFKWN
jgi:hypothetical protein